MREPHRAAQVALVVCGIAAAFLYANFLLDYLISRKNFNVIVSDLEAPGAANAGLLRVTDVICAVLVLVPLPFVRRALPRGFWSVVAIWSTVAFAALAAFAAFIALPCAEGESCPGSSESLKILLHDGASIASDTLLFVGAGAVGIATWRSGPRWLTRTAWAEVLIGGALASALFGIFNAMDPTSWATGLSQRFHILCISAWLICLAVYAATDGLRAGSGAPDPAPAEAPPPA